MIVVSYSRCCEITTTAATTTTTSTTIRKQNVYISRVSLRDTECTESSTFAKRCCSSVRWFTRQSDRENEDNSDKVKWNDRSLDAIDVYQQTTANRIPFQKIVPYFFFRGCDTNSRSFTLWCCIRNERLPISDSRLCGIRMMNHREIDDLKLLLG